MQCTVFINHELVVAKNLERRGLFHCTAITVLNDGFDEIDEPDFGSIEIAIT